MHVYLPFAAARARRCGFLTQLELCKGENVVSDYGPGHDAETWFKEAFTKGGGQVIEALRAPLASPDFAPFLQRARDTQPEAVYVFVPSGQAAILIKQFVERGICASGHQADWTGRHHRRRSAQRHGRPGETPIVCNAAVEPIRARGSINFLLIALIVAAILLSATWDPGINFDICGTELALQNLVRDAALVLIAMLSLWLTADEHRAANGFTWEPIKEVAKLFAGIFVAIIPVLVMLGAGKNGAFAWLLSAVSERDGAPHEVAYFWLTGILSAVLDNAPTYLVFFQLAGGDARELMGPLAGTLASISMGAVYMGALTYIGNAPNFMVNAIATERGVRMPSFFGYMMWAGVVLVPLFLLLTLLPIAPVLKLS